MAFVAKGDKLKAELNREREEIAREREVVARERVDIARERESFAREVEALDELLKEVRRPEQEFEKLTKDYEELLHRMECFSEQQSLEATKAKEQIGLLRKELKDEKIKSELANERAKTATDKYTALTDTNDNLSRKLNFLGTKYERERKLHELTKEENASLKQKHKVILREKRELLQQNEELLVQNANREKEVASHKKSIQNLKIKISGLEARISKKQPASFVVSDPDLLDALSREPVEYFYPPRNIVTLGFGPIDEDVFDAYLKAHGKQPMTAGPWIIVGRDGWTEEKLNKLVDKANLDDVRVFSQELFIAGMLTTHDPFSLPTEILMKFAEGHPALEYLIASGFEWPEISLEEDYGEPVYLRGSYERVEESPLFRMGYQVGITKGQPRLARRSLLKNAYEGEIPEVEDDDYMEEWSLPGRSKRLWRIAHHIAWLIRSRQTIPSMCYAVDDWQEDLDWLEEQFYTNRMRFQWPHG